MITNQYTFNGDGQRVQIVDSQGTKKPIWDGEKILLETDGAAARQASTYSTPWARHESLPAQPATSAAATTFGDWLVSVWGIIFSDRQYRP
jgi:hypothetical protein